MSDPNMNGACLPLQAAWAYTEGDARTNLERALRAGDPDAHDAPAALRILTYNGVSLLATVFGHTGDALAEGRPRAFHRNGSDIVVEFSDDDSATITVGSKGASVALVAGSEDGADALERLLNTII